MVNIKPLETFLYTDVKSFPESSAIYRAYWDSVSCTLLVDFRHGGKSAAYALGVAKNWHDLLAAKSKGRHYSKKIKGKFDTIPLAHGVKVEHRAFTDTTSIAEPEKIKVFKWSYNRVFPESGVLLEGFYDSPTRTLLICFRSGGNTVYRNVPFSTWRELMGADSKGHYFSKNIRDKFETLPVDDDLTLVSRFSEAKMASPGPIESLTNATFVIKAEVDGTMSFTVSGKDIRTPDDALRGFQEFMTKASFEGKLKVKELTQRFE